MKQPIRIVIIEDSAVVSMLLKAILNNEADMEVVGVAADGREGVRLVSELRPDLITMDIRMPVMDGFEATREIMSSHPTPIVVISSSVDDEELKITFRAIEVGALSVLEKPHGPGNPQFESNRREIVEMVRAMADVKVFRHQRYRGERVGAGVGSSPAPTSSCSCSSMPSSRSPAQPFELVAVGASTGGPQALHALLRNLPADFPLPICVVQHISPGFVGGLIQWLNTDSALRVKMAEQGELLRAGQVYFAQDGKHLQVNRAMDGGLQAGYVLEPESLHRPAVDQLFNSVARECGAMAIGVILTGMGDDGAKGMKRMQERLAMTIAQDEASCVVAGMPRSAVKCGAVKEIVEMDRVGPRLIELTLPMRLIKKSMVFS
ncbi:response regulator receiver modulated CheB methylesterase [Magnetococcus marinus MC-1]|uniref:Protein-glutamate methylesterase/protein-glutamine glutaminase n=1 Tax=Magnetococcus marinus (strain ATCC BAA-1437 / JCM 17883 / MC-1) TaxID=156889 RepID=A0L8Q0_MAGMM|nr:chemotaxis-specific protein-glutamate methyltransferase CheB [Magnetococcus marinus]ABK44343.1 response regulator receiver modulated CheB methylesterase [Magnetococcus marinus MC-1]